jgi:DNA primase
MPETIKEFRLGFSPDVWETIKNYLLGKGYTEKELVEAGLVIEKEEGGTYDRFRNRLMFPICDIQGRVTGFGASSLNFELAVWTNDMTLKPRAYLSDIFFALERKLYRMLGCPGKAIAPRRNRLTAGASRRWTSTVCSPVWRRG